MHLSYNKKAADPIYYIQYSKRNGKKVSTKNYKRVGKHSELLAITDDPLEYAKKILAECDEEEASEKSTITETIDFKKKLINTGYTVSQNTGVNIGYLYLQSVYQQLHLKEFFMLTTSKRKMEYNCNDVNRFLTYARILDPKSKSGTFDNLHNFYENPDITYDAMLDFLDVLSDNYDAYIEYLFDQSDHIVKRDTTVCYYDCTNYFFETEMADPDGIDEKTGEIVKGMRKYGHSKEHRPNPIVEMGLFMDSNGIPLTMCVTSGSDNEQITSVPLEKKLVKMIEGQKFIYCADAGLGSANIRIFNDMGGRAFIVAQSVKKLSDVLKKAVFNDYDYRRLSDNSKITINAMKIFDRSEPSNLDLYNDQAYKVLETETAVDLGLSEEKHYKNGSVRMVKSKAKLKQRVIITFSRKMLEYNRSIRKGQIDRAKAILASKDPEKVKKGEHDVTRFIRRVGKSEDDEYELNEDAIKQEEMYDGYYAVATNLNDDVKEILAINSQRYKIEDCFKVMKTNFKGRPAYVHLPPHIIGHFLTCYTALLIYRLLEVQLDERGNHHTVDEVITTLKNMNLTNHNDLYYLALYTGSDTLSALNDLYPLDLDDENYLPKTLNKKVRNLLK